MLPKSYIALWIVFFCVGICCCFDGYSKLKKEEVDMIVHCQSVNWPTAKAVIKTSDIERIENTKHPEDPRYRAELTYAYKVGDKEYEGDRICFDSATSLSFDQDKEELFWLEKMMEHYKPKSVHKVFYDPKDPDNAVLLPGIDPYTYQLNGAGIIFLGLFFIASSLITPLVVILFRLNRDLFIRFAWITVFICCTPIIFYGFSYQRDLVLKKADSASFLTIEDDGYKIGDVQKSQLIPY